MDGGTYVTPDESVVSEFMEDIQGKSTSMSYEVADEQVVTGLMNSLKRKQTLNGLTAGKLPYSITLSIGHFRDAASLCFKTKPSAKPFL